MARFLKSKYELGNGLVVLCEMSEPEVAVAGTEPAGATDLPLTAYVSGSRRRNGVHVRGMNLTREVGTAPDTFTKSTFVALRSIADAAAATNQPGQTKTIGGVAWTVASLRPEIII